MIADWWGRRPLKDKRLALISVVLVVAALTGWALGGSPVPPAVALVVGLTNMLGGAWSKLHWSRWVLIWGLAVGAAAVTTAVAAGSGWGVPSALGVVAACANVLVLLIRVNLRDR